MKMIKKILFIVFLILISISIDKILGYESDIIIRAFDYEIMTKVGFLVFLATAFILLCYLIFYLFSIIFYPNLKKYKKNEKKHNQQFKDYIELITEGFILKSTKNTKEAFNKLKKANKIFKNTNLSKLLESQIYYASGDFDKSEKIFKEIKNKNINLDLVALSGKLKMAKKQDNTEDMQKYAENIIAMDPTNRNALKYLYTIYISKKEWEKANNILNVSLQIGVIDKSKSKDSILFLYTALGKYYYDNQEFFNAKKFLKKAYKIDYTYIQATILLVETYIALGKKSKAIDIIKKAWKVNTNPKLADLYLSLISIKDLETLKPYKTLYNLNSRSFESNLLMSKIYLKQKLYSKARKYAKIAEEENETKELYEVMLQIEQEDNGSSALINNLKQKILKLKNSCWKCSICNREYIKWQPECNNCSGIDTLRWKE